MVTVSCSINMEDVRVNEVKMGGSDWSYVSQVIRSMSSGVRVNLGYDGLITITVIGRAIMKHELYVWLWKDIIVPLRAGRESVRFIKNPTFEDNVNRFSGMYVYGDELCVVLNSDWYTYRSGITEKPVKGEIRFKRVNDIIIIRDWYVHESVRGIGYGKQLMAQAIRLFIEEVGITSTVYAVLKREDEDFNAWFCTKFNAVRRSCFDDVEDAPTLITEIDEEVFYEYLGIHRIER